jgi:hypothetical protein
MDAVARGVAVRAPEKGITYQGFVDMSGGSSDDACLAVAHKDIDGKAILDRIVNQGQRPPFDPAVAVRKFVGVLRDYRISSVTGDSYAGQTFQAQFTNAGVGYAVSELSKSEIYESVEPNFNSGKIVLLDVQELESQFLGLVWRGNKIDHANGEHDDWSNACAGVIHKIMSGATLDLSLMQAFGRRTIVANRDWADQSVVGQADDGLHWADRVMGAGRGRVGFDCW